MTFDDRIDRLTERHEALAQSLELLTAEVGKLTADAQRTRRDLRELNNIVSSIPEGTLRLMNVGDNHERRLGSLEAGD